MNRTSRLLFFLLSISISSLAQNPLNFQNNIFASGFNGVNGIAFSSNGIAYVWEKEGRLKVKNTNGSWSIMLDISEEVDPIGDHGLKGFVLDPNFLSNGYFYLMYEVDRHHLLYYGTNNYNPSANSWGQATIGRITRYTALASINFTTVNLASRLVLLGTGFTDGVPIVHETHGVGSLIFGTDGTLIASFGESSTYSGADSGYASDTYYQQALVDGILHSDDPATTTINENDNVGSWRAQMKSSLSGKIIRISPTTGNGVSSNPFYDASAPRSAASRVWALGLRNPFRITLKPNTGEHLPSAGNPGTIYVGDIGSFLREEIDVVTGAGQNFGWPRFEGIVEQTNPVVSYPSNRLAQFSVPFIHKHAAVDFREYPAKAYVNGQIYEIGTSATNAIAGPNFLGGCSIGGLFYNGTNFPAEYQGRYLHGDFNNNSDPVRSWIHGFSMNNQDELTQMHSFLPLTLGVTGMAINPINGYLYYASYTGTIREVKYDTGNQPPVASATQNVLYGTSPLTVQFNASSSTDPENGALTYSWNFGDGSAVSTNVSPSHIFISPNSNPTQYNVTLTVTDNQNQSNTSTLIVSTNNTPPIINSTTVSSMNYFANTNNVSVALTANVSDAQTTTSQLAFKWQTALYHNTHHHPNPISYSQSSSISFSPVPCNESYFYKVTLTVTDLQGLSTTFTKDILPNCSNLDIDAPSIPTNVIFTNKSQNSVSLSWTASTDNIGIAVYEIFKNGVKIDESLNNQYVVSGLTMQTQYSFSITAKDAGGNSSSQSTPLNVITLGATQDFIIFGDVLNTNWQNNATISSLYLSNAAQPFINTTSIKVTNPTINQALDFRFNSSYIDTTGYPGGLDFWVYNQGNTPYPFQIQTFANNTGGGGSGSINVTADANKWTHFQFEWSLFGSPSKVGGIVIRLNQTQTESLYFDEIKLLHCADMYSINSGNWNASATWSCGRVPIVTDDITIKAGHTVSIPNGVNATLKFLYLLGTLNPLSGSTSNIYKF